MGFAMFTLSLLAFHVLIASFFVWRLSDRLEQESDTIGVSLGYHVMTSIRMPYWLLWPFWHAHKVAVTVNFMSQPPADLSEEETDAERERRFVVAETISDFVYDEVYGEED